MDNPYEPSISKKAWTLMQLKEIHDKVVANFYGLGGPPSPKDPDDGEDTG